MPVDRVYPPRKESPEPPDSRRNRPSKVDSKEFPRRWGNIPGQHFALPERLGCPGLDERVELSRLETEEAASPSARRLRLRGVALRAIKIARATQLAIRLGSGSGPGEGLSGRVARASSTSCLATLAGRSEIAFKGSDVVD